MTFVERAIEAHREIFQLTSEDREQRSAEELRRVLELPEDAPLEQRAGADGSPGPDTGCYWWKFEDMLFRVSVHLPEQYLTDKFSVTVELHDWQRMRLQPITRLSDVGEIRACYVWRGWTWREEV